MKIQATRKFIDIKEGVTRKKGDIFDVTEERFEEINGTKYGILATNLEEVEEVNFEEMTVAQIKELLDKQGIEFNSKAKKDELINLIAGD